MPARSARAFTVALVAVTVLLVVAGVVIRVFGGDVDDSVDGRPTVRTIDVVATYDHDPVLYTQGLEFVGDLLIESGGQRGESRLRVYDPVDGEVIDDRRLPDELFGEGATVVDDRVWQLTWTSGRALRYTLDGLEPVDEVSYQGEGWGLCLLDDQLVMSDGSDRLTFRDVDSFEAESTVAVTLDGVPVELLNELECVRGDDPSDDRVWANVYQTNMIYGIDPATGSITDVVDATTLVPPGFEGDTELVLNGIAHHRETGRFWLTGKRWPVLYEAEFGSGG